MNNNRDILFNNSSFEKVKKKTSTAKTRFSDKPK